MFLRSPPTLPASLRAAAFAALAAIAYSPALALVNGTATTSFHAVGEIGGTSGVLVADNWVLTASHVASGVSAGVTAFVTQAGSAVIDAVYLAPGASFPGNDLALLHLSTSLSSVSTPMLDGTALSNAAAASLGNVTLTSAQNQAPNGYAFATLAGTVPTYTDTQTNTHYTTHWLITQGAAYVQGGDSGGGLFLGQVTDSTGSVLMGVASAQLQDNGTYYSAWVEVAPYRAWIDSTIAASGQSVAWTAPVPDAPGLVSILAGLGALGMVWRRKRFPE